MRRERGRVKRARVLLTGLGSSGEVLGGLPSGEGEVLMGGLLAREIGVMNGLGGRSGGGGLGVDGGEVVARAWAGGLKGKGSMGRLQWPGNAISAMWVGGSDVKSGLGLAYAVVDGACPAASYIPRDAEDW